MLRHTNYKGAIMKKVIAFALILLTVFSLCACEYTKDGDEGYVPQSEYTLPTKSTAEKDSVPYAVASLIAKGQVVRDYYELQAAPIGAEQSFAIRTNGITVEIYKFSDDSPLLAEIKKTGVYPLKNDEGTVVATRKAAINSHFVLMIPADTNAKGENITELNQKLIDRFTSLKL